jgi:hypothetical protein
MYAWAADPARGNILPAGFQNPFTQSGIGVRRPVRDLFGEPDITSVMAAEFLGTCDAFQLPIFATLVLYGLRAAEPTWLFREHFCHQWLKVACIPEMGLYSKGRLDKRFPLIKSLRELWLPTAGTSCGLLFVRRDATMRGTDLPLFGVSLESLIVEYRQRCAADGIEAAAGRERLRDKLLAAAGGLNYDHIEGEFQAVARRLNWPRAATLKDFRHLFCTSLENAGVAESYRRYFMGQSTGKAPIVSYTHLNQLEPQFQKAVDQDLAPLVRAIERRARELGLITVEGTANGQV